LVTAGEDRVVRLWDVAAGKALREFAGHENPVLGIAPSPDGRAVASVSGGYGKKAPDEVVRLWEVASGKERRRFAGHRFVVGWLDWGMLPSRPCAGLWRASRPWKSAGASN